MPSAATARQERRNVAYLAHGLEGVLVGARGDGDAAILDLDEVLLVQVLGQDLRVRVLDVRAVDLDLRATEWASLAIEHKHATAAGTLYGKRCQSIEWAVTQRAQQQNGSEQRTAALEQQQYAAEARKPAGSSNKISARGLQRTEAAVGLGLAVTSCLS
jgi:hypothetical protein